MCGKLFFTKDFIVECPDCGKEVRINIASNSQVYNVEDIQVYNCQICGNYFMYNFTLNIKATVYKSKTRWRKTYESRSEI